jgi:hypothetical protein
MGDCERLNEHISDYLENNLDPAMRAEFEQGLERFPELKQSTSQIKKIAGLLGKLPGRKCSDDFVPKLRQRISSAVPVRSNQLNLRRYAWAFSFVIIVLIALVGINTLLTRDESVPALPVVNEFQPAPASVAGSTVSDPAGVYSTGSSSSAGNEVDIKTRAESRMVNDSSAIRGTEQENSRAKQVGHTAP